MILGVCRITLFLPENDSLKGKRSVLRPLLAKARHRFNLAAAEVAHADDHHNAELAFVVVSSSSRHVDEMLGQVVRFCESTCPAEISAISTERIAVNAAVGPNMATGGDFELPAHWRGA